MNVLYFFFFYLIFLKQSRYHDPLQPEKQSLNTPASKICTKHVTPLNKLETREMCT